jgi:hypothetical protein
VQLKHPFDQPPLRLAVANLSVCQRSSRHQPEDRAFGFKFGEVRDF